MITIFDLDHTLLNAEKLKKQTAKILGMSFDEFKKQYKEYFKDLGVNYSFEEHLNLLEKKNIISSEEKTEMRQKFNEILGNMDKCLNEGARELVLEEKQRASKLVLMTLGNKEWQEEKVSRLPSIAGLFDKIIYEDTDKAKSEFFKKIIQKEKDVLIINDNIEETEKIIKILGREKCQAKIVKSSYSDKKRAKKLGFDFFENIHEMVLRKDQNNENSV